VRRLLLIALGVLATRAHALQLPAAMSAPPCVACGVDATEVRRTFSDENWKALGSGAILTSETSGPDPHDQRSVAAAGIIHYPPGQVWSVVTDFESRPHYVSNTKEVHITRIEGARVWVAQRLRILLTSIRFAVICTLDPEHGSVRWTLDQNAEHDIAGTTGSWQLVPVANGRETFVSYRAWIDSGRPVPGFIENFMLKRTLPGLIAGVRDEVRRRFAR